MGGLLVKIALAAAAALALAGPALAQTPPAAAPAVAPAPDYADGAAWLCLPGRADPCAANQDATIIAANGTRTIETFKPDPAPKFDCFYVYPTVSLDPTPNSDLNAGTEEKTVAAIQAGRFARHCRVFAPLYRQVTITALQALLAGKAVSADRALAYADVKAAWAQYLARDNKGRGVVLIGHSQGSFVLKQLIAEEIDGKPVQNRLVSAMLIGANVGVPSGKDVGGDFKTVPLCRAAGQSGCVVSYVTFRETAPPPANSRFGVVPEAGWQAACTNPAALGGGKAVTDNYLPSKSGFGAAPMGPWTTDGAPVTTPFVKVPGLLSASCKQDGKFNYLALAVNADPADPRTDTITGDVVVFGKVLPDWGLHLIDMPVAMGDLVELANSQAKAWQRRR